MRTNHELSDEELVHDAALELMSDPEKYSPWQHGFVEDVLGRFKKGEIETLTIKQKVQIKKILEDL